MDKHKILWCKFSSHPIYNYLIKYISKKYNNIDFFITSKNSIFNNNKINEIYLNSKSRLFKIPGTERTPGLKKLFNKVKPDIIITNLYYTLYAYKAYKYAKKNNIKLIINTEEKHNKGLLRKILFPIWDLFVGKKMLNHPNTKILAWSKDSQNFMRKIVKDKSKVKLFLAGVDTNTFYSLKKHKNSNKLKILMAARMVPCKDHHILLKALKVIKQKNILNFELTLLGKSNTPLKTKIVNIIKDYNLEKDVNIIEKIPHDKMRDTYCSHNIFILPSKSEGVGLVVPEAMACGLPVIISDSVGAKDYVIEEKNGLIFKTGDYNDLVEKIIQISKMNLEAMGKSAETHIKENYNIEKVSNYFYSLIINN